MPLPMTLKEWSYKKKENYILELKDCDRSSWDNDIYILDLSNLEESSAISECHGNRGWALGSKGKDGFSFGYWVGSSSRHLCADVEQTLEMLIWNSWKKLQRLD